MTDDFRDDEAVPLDADDFLIQRYLDGALDDEETLQVEFRMDEDPAFAARIHGYESMFAALDASAVARSAVLWSPDMPASIVEAALNRWQPDHAAPIEDAAPVASGVEQVFGGWRPAVTTFFFADVVLVALIAVLALTRGPADMLRSTVITAKDIALFGIINGPSPEQLSVVVPVTAVAAIVALFGVWSGMRSVWAHTGTSS